MSNSQRANNASVESRKQSRASRVQTLLPLVAERNPQACQELVKLYERDIESIACRFSPGASYKGIDFERKADLASMGKQVLLKLADAAVKSGYSSGASNYISRFLYKEMQKEANKTKALYNVTESLICVINTVKHCIERFAQEYCTDKRPLASWIANETGLSEDKVLDVLHYLYGGCEPICDYMRGYNCDDDDVVYGVLDKMAASDSADSLLIASDLETVVEDVLKRQSARDQRIFLRKMGLSDDRTDWTSESIADEESMTVARVNQIVRKVQNDLRESITTIYRMAE